MALTVNVDQIAASSTNAKTLDVTTVVGEVSGVIVIDQHYTNGTITGDKMMRRLKLTPVNAPTDDGSNLSYSISEILFDGTVNFTTVGVDPADNDAAASAERALISTSIQSTNDLLTNGGDGPS